MAGIGTSGAGIGDLLKKLGSALGMGGGAEAGAGGGKKLPSLGDKIKDMAAAGATAAPKVGGSPGPFMPGELVASRPMEKPALSWHNSASAPLPATSSELVGFDTTVKPSTGVFDRIGEFIKSDRGRAALLRSGAETMQHGLGAGVAAGAQYYDDQKEKDQKQANWLDEIGLRRKGVEIDQQQADTQGAYYGAKAENDATANAIDADRLRQAIWKDKVGYALNQLELDSLNRYRAGQIGLGYRKDETDRLGQEVTKRGQTLTHDASIYGTDSANWRHVTPSASGAGIGTKFSATWPATSDAPGVTMSGQFATPSKQSIDFLKANPNLKGEFERQYGPGSAAVYLGGR